MKDNGAASQTIVFERNDKYTGSHPALAKKMTWQILPDDTTRTNAITSGAVQAIDAVPVANLASMSEPVKVAAQQGFSLLFAMFNNRTFSDARARQAILYALNYEEICSTGFPIHFFYTFPAIIFTRLSFAGTGTGCAAPRWPGLWG